PAKSPSWDGNGKSTRSSRRAKPRTNTIELMYRVALICLLPLLAFADSMDDLRLRWAQMLTGGTLDPTIAEVRSRLSSVQSTANREWTSMQKAANRQSLWTDLASTTDSAAISSNYGRLHDLAIAWATPGQSLYQNPSLLADTLSGM